MAQSTHPAFDQTTEALDAAQAFAKQIKGKTVLITGVNRGGIGYTTAEAFASQNAETLVIAGRNPARVQTCIDELQKTYPNVTYRALKLDLSSQEAVRAAAAEVLSWDDLPAIHIVVNSAGVMNLPERILSPDGIEMTFATNHVGHFLFTNLIMPKVIAAAKNSEKGATRIINVTSLSPTRAGIRWSDLNFEKVNKTLPADEQPDYNMLKFWGAVDSEEKSYVPIEAYNQSKVANVLFSIGLNNRFYESHGILSFAVHPGIIMTELSRNVDEATGKALEGILKTPGLYVKTLGAGASTSVVAGVCPHAILPTTQGDDEGTGKENLGVYWIDCQVSDKANGRAVSSQNAERLWGVTEGLVGEEFAPRRLKERI